MKKLFITLCAIALSFCFCLSCGAAMLSPGISVLQANVKMEKGGVADNKVTFSAEDVEKALGVKSAPSVKITSLPENGELMLGSARVSVGMVVPKERLSELCFIPSEKRGNTCFGFVPAGSEYVEDFVCVISIADELDTAPTTENGALADMAGITVFSMLHGEDAQGDALRFSIVSGASHGTVEITDEQTGAYKYTPDEGYSGKDSFSFCVTDEGGNVSNISTVTVNVARNGKNIVYDDMKDSALHLAAAVLYEKDIMLGVSAESFDPNGKISRSDFLIMAMDTVGIKPGTGESDFADACDFTPYEKKYIAAASELGIVIGSDTEDGRCFLPDDSITEEEAALIVCRIAALNGLDIVGGDIAVSVMQGDSYDACGVLAEAGIFESESYKNELSRASAAQILYAMLGLAQ